MSKKKTNPDRKDLTIPALPDPIFVVELDKHVLMTGLPIKECIFPHYRFDNDCVAAYDCAYDIAGKSNKLMADVVNFSLDEPFIFDPKEIARQISCINDTIRLAQTELRAAWARQDAL